MTREVPMRSLSRSQQEKLGRDETDGLAQELVAEEFDLEERDDEAEWYDVRASDGSTKGEVKSTHPRIGDEYPADGRFRVRRDQTRSLSASDGSETVTAWYFFVLFDDPGGVVRIQRRKPSTVTRLVEERGGWNEAGHEEFDYQHKLPIGTVVRRD